MKALILALLLAAPAVAQTPPQKIYPIAVVFHEFCGKLQGAAVTLSNGQIVVFDREEIEGDPRIAAELEALPKIRVHLSAPDMCSCFT